MAQLVQQQRDLTSHDHRGAERPPAWRAPNREAAGTMAWPRSTVPSTTMGAQRQLTAISIAFSRATVTARGNKGDYSSRAGARAKTCNAVVSMDPDARPGRPRAARDSVAGGGGFAARVRIRRFRADDRRPCARPAPTPFRLTDPTPSTKRFAPVEEPPPTLAPAATPTAQPRATPTGERVVVTNTGGLGAVLRAEPVSGVPIASLREQLEVTLLERRQVGGTEWARVRTPDGQEGWVLGVVARPAPAPRP